MTKEQYLKLIKSFIKDKGGFLKLKGAIFPDSDENKIGDNPFALSGMYIQEMWEDGTIFYYFRKFQDGNIKDLSEKQLVCIWNAIEEGKYSIFSRASLINKVKEEAGHIKLIKPLSYNNGMYLTTVTEKKITLNQVSYKYSDVSEDMLEAIYKSILEGNFI